MARITPITKKREIYSDFPKDLYLNPVSFDVSRKTNEEAVKDAIRNLLLTNKGERLFQPRIGSDIRKYLFENYTPATTQILKDNIRTVLNRYEPRAELLDVSVIGSPDQNAVQIHVAFAVTMQEDPVTLTVIVERLR